MTVKSAWVWTLAVLAGCGGGASRQVVDVGAPPMRSPVTVLAGQGVTVEAGGGWRKLDQGRALSGVTRVRAPGGALLGFPDGTRSGGKLWLGAGSEVALGQRGGSARIAVERGRARLRAGGDDRVFAREGQGVRATSVAEQPDAADWSVEVTTPRPRAGVGELAARPLAGGARVDLALARLEVRARRVGDVVETEVEHVFHNGSAQRLEGQFRFPLPEGAQVIGLAMDMNGKLMEGELVEREKAKKIYEEIVNQMEDPALLEWDEGNRFSLHVFPIEAQADKRIVLRFVTPLKRTGDGYRFAYETASDVSNSQHEKIGDFRFTWNGSVMKHEKDFTPGEDLVVNVPASDLAAAYQETRADGVYTSLRVRAEVPAGPRDTGVRSLYLVIDTSRSALEERKLGEDAVRAILEELGADGRFQLAACDLTCREAGPARTATPEQIDAALAWLGKLDYDGASDLGTALRFAGEHAEARADVVYLGDGTATWGETAPEALRAVAAQALGTRALHAVALGKGASIDLLRALAGERGGRSARPVSMYDARRFALAVAHGNASRLRGVRVLADGATVVYPQGPSTLFAGDELPVVIFTPKGQPVPRALGLTGFAGERENKQSIRIGAAEPAKHVAKRWASERMRELELSGGKDEDLIKLSLDFGVLSKKTAYLVLESEEAYAKYQIERKNKEAADAAAPRVTGADLESVNGRDSELSPDHIQPGDPEVRVPAPRDARQVIVVFPFGESKVAAWDDATQAWTVRFLIDQDTPDGTYWVVVRITHADGTLETQRLSYVVDTTPPDMALTLTQAEGGVIRIAAHQVVPAGAEPDCRLVELDLPDGQRLMLRVLTTGEMTGTWKPRAALSGPVKLRMVASDRALNQSVRELEVPVQ